MEGSESQTTRLLASQAMFRGVPQSDGQSVGLFGISDSGSDCYGLLREYLSWTTLLSSPSHPVSKLVPSAPLHPFQRSRLCLDCCVPNLRRVLHCSVLSNHKSVPSSGTLHLRDSLIFVVLWDLRCVC